MSKRKRRLNGTGKADAGVALHHAGVGVAESTWGSLRENAKLLHVSKTPQASIRVESSGLVAFTPSIKSLLYGVDASRFCVGTRLHRGSAVWPGHASMDDASPERLIARLTVTGHSGKTCTNFLHPRAPGRASASQTDRHKARFVTSSSHVLICHSIPVPDSLSNRCTAPIL